MTTFSEAVQTADWKSEKHVPVIECADQVRADEFIPVKVTLGKAVAHPNTTEHHICWIQLFFLPAGAKAPIQLANFEFSAHGAAVDGPNSSTVYTHHEGTAAFKTGKSGTLLALAYCNIHGVWQSAKPLKIA